jgi:hypothetical protein
VLGGTVQDTEQVHSVSNKAYREDGLNTLTGSMNQVILPQGQKNPTGASCDEGPDDGRAGPAPNIGTGFLESKDHEDGCRSEQQVAEEIDLGNGRRGVVSVASFLGPEGVDGQHCEGTKGDTANPSALRSTEETGGPPT